MQTCTPSRHNSPWSRVERREKIFQLSIRRRRIQSVGEQTTEPHRHVPHYRDSGEDCRRHKFDDLRNQPQIGRAHV